MRTISAIAAVVALGAPASPALADGVKPGCGAGPHMSISVDAMKARIDGLGYDLQRLKIDDGCFKAYIVDRQSGGVVKVAFSPATGELVRAALAAR